MKIIPIKCGLFLLLTLLAVPQNAQAADSPAKAGASQRLKTIIVNNYHPYTFMNDKGEPDGFSVEIARAVAKSMDIELEIRADKWDQAMKELEAGSIDLLPMMAQSPERDKTFDFSVPHTIAYDTIFFKKGSTGIRTLEDLSNKTVIVMNRDIAHSYLLSSGSSKSMTLNLVDSLPEALKQLAAGNGDAAIMPKLVGIVTAKKLNLSEIETSPQIIGSYTRPFSFAVKDGNHALLERLNQGLNIIKSSGEYDAIYKKWFGTLEDPHLELKTVIKYGTAAALILLGFVVWNIMLSRQVKAKTGHLEIEIAEHRRAEELLRLFKESVDNSTDAIGMATPEGKHVYQNQAFDNLFGEIAGNPMDVYKDQNIAREVFKTIVAGERWNGEVEMYAKDKSVLKILLRAYPNKDDDGRIMGVVGIHSDITERKQADAMLRDSEEKYRLLVNNLSSGVVVHAPDSSVVFSNPMASTLLGLNSDQMHGKEAMDPAWSFLRENSASVPVAEYPVNRVLSSGEPIANQVLGIRRPDLAEPVWVQCNAYPVTAADGTLLQVVVTFSDITERKRDKEIIEKRLVSLTQPLDSGSISFDDLFNIDEVQRLQDEFATATGVASLILRPDGTPLTVPSNFTRLCNDIIRTNEKGCANCRKSDVAIGSFNPDGPIIQQCLSGGLWDAGAAIVVNGQHIASWLIGQVRDETQSEETMAIYAREIGADEDSFMAAFREVPSMSRRQFEKIAQVLFTLATQLSTAAYQNIQQARFIAERKVYEKELQQKNAELERFTYTVSHDLKSPIITIKGFTGSLERDLAKGNYERMTGDLKRVSDAADKMNDLLRDLLELSTIGRIVNTPETVDMNLLAADVLAQLAGPLKNRNLTVAVQPDFPVVLCDRRRMAEVLQNLLENAINYMGEQAEPQIQFGMRDEAGENIFFVQDNGIGIDEKYHKVIFGLFNKLEAESNGTGIGLALVKRIIEVHGGKVWVESEGEGLGSKFCFTIKGATK